MSDSLEVKKGLCAFCTNFCGALVHVEKGKVIKVEGNPAHPLSQGFICARARLAPKWLYHPNQLMHPLKRIGQRGEGKWQRVGWDEAMGEIGQKLLDLRQSHGAETLGVVGGEDKGNNYWPRGRFLSSFGNPQNYFAAGVMCGVGDMAMNRAIMGYDSSHSGTVGGGKCIVQWGCNPAESNQRAWTNLIKQREQDEVKVIAIDPRRTRTTDIADIWLQPRPGTDAALALAWLNVIINEQLHDKNFVENWTVGFDKLEERVQEYPPQSVSEITGVPAEKIGASARMYATSKPASIAFGVAADHFGLNSMRTEQARVLLRALTGNLGQFGGEMIMRPGMLINGGKFITETDLMFLDRLPAEIRRKQLGADQCKLVSFVGYDMTAETIENVWGIKSPACFQLQAHVPLLWRTIITGNPYPMKALITCAANPVVTMGNSNAVYEALKSENLELHVVHELFMTPTALLADYVLPAANWLERDICTNYGDYIPFIFGGEKAISPLGERQDVYQFFRRLALAAGQCREDWPWETTEEVSDYRLKPLGLTFRDLVDRTVLRPDQLDLKPWEKTGFPTPSGKIELYSSILEKLGHDPLPHYEEAPESPVSAPELVHEFPLILNTGGRFMPMHNSDLMQKGIGAREKYPDPLMDIHPETAEKLEIGDGDWVTIETRRGKIRQKAKYNAGIVPNVVNCQAGWWFPEKEANEPVLSGLWDSNANLLVLDDIEACDRLSGGWCVRALMCRVSKNSLSRP